MNRRHFLGLCLTLPLAFVKTETAKANSFESGLVFPFAFPEEDIISKHNYTADVQISNFKNEGLFSQLWHELLQLIK